MLRQPARLAARGDDRSSNGTEYGKGDKPTNGKRDFYYKAGIFFVLLSFSAIGIFHRPVEETNLNEESKIERLNNSNKPRTLAVIDPKKERKIVLVHLGRAGGLTIRRNTAANCWDDFSQNAEQRTNCFYQYSPAQKIASQTRDVMDSIHSPDAVETASSFLIPIRNPIDRVLDAYRTSHPANCHDETCGQHELFTTCFPNPDPEHFAQAILPNYNVRHFFKDQTVQQKCDCRALARRTVQGASPIIPALQFNFQYYANKSYRQYLHKEIFAIRMEHQQEDLEALEVSLGGSSVDIVPISTNRKAMDETPAPLSGEAVKKLCCVLNEELEVYFDLFDKALNLTPADKEQADQELRQQCGLKPENGWDKWRRGCLQRFAEPAWSKCAAPAQTSN